MATESVLPLPEQCHKCKQFFPPTLEYFVKNKARTNGLSIWCKACHRENTRKYRAEHPDKAKASSDRYKAEHPDKIKADNKRWNDAHRGKIHDTNQERYWSNPEKARAAAREYALLHPEHVAEKKREHYQRTHPTRIEHARQYREDNPDKLRAWNRKHDARKQELPCNFSPEAESRMFAYWDNRCAVCGAPAGLWVTLAADHWIAQKDQRIDNPGTVAINMLPLCHAKKGIPAGISCCNNSKYNKDPEQWLLSRLGKRKAATILKRINSYFEWVREQDGLS